MASEVTSLPHQLAAYCLLLRKQEPGASSRWSSGRLQTAHNFFTMPWVAARLQAVAAGEGGAGGQAPGASRRSKAGEKVRRTL